VLVLQALLSLLLLLQALLSLLLPLLLLQALLSLLLPARAAGRVAAAPLGHQTQGLHRWAGLMLLLLLLLVVVVVVLLLLLAQAAGRVAAAPLGHRVQGLHRWGVLLLLLQLLLLLLLLGVVVVLPLQLERRALTLGQRLHQRQRRLGWVPAQGGQHTLVGVHTCRGGLPEQGTLLVPREGTRRPLAWLTPLSVVFWLALRRHSGVPTMFNA
jgi:hypothetical protein